MYLANLKERIYNQSLSELPSDKILVNCLNAHSFNIAKKDKFFQSALLKSDVILPDGIGIVYALRFLTGASLGKISGHMLFDYEMKRLNQINGRCFFLGSSETTCCLIKNRGSIEFPNIKIDFYCPPYKKEFSEKDNKIMVNKVNAFHPDVLFIGLTAPKQEKWAAEHFDTLNAKHICSIGAVFDFYAGTCNRAPRWVINLGFEWLHRLKSEPKRLWRRYVFGNPKFVVLIIMEKMQIAGVNFLQRMWILDRISIPKFTRLMYNKIQSLFM